MGNHNKKEEEKSIDVEFKISMHCNACERKIVRIISKFKGVEKFTTDVNNDMVTVTGKIDPKKVLKKLKKKTGKKVEMAIKEEDEKGGKCNGEDPDMFQQDWEPTGSDDQLLLFSSCREREAFLVFSDENPNALCSIM